jgi:uncharacterized protein YceH (UPF0502 family)
MSDNRQYIEKLCEEIQQRGGTPTVGILRSRSTRPLPIREVIETLKHWKSNPTSNKESNSDQTSVDKRNTVTLEDRVAILEEQVVLLKQQLRTLSKNNGA